MLLSAPARMPMSMAGPAHRAWLSLLGLIAILVCASARVDAADPVITSPATAAATVGQPFTYQITATNTPTAYSAANLPTGLSVDASGLISGTPTSMPLTNPGAFPVTVAAGNTSGTGSATVTITESLPAGDIAAVAGMGTGFQGFSGDGGAAWQAEVDIPSILCTDAQGDLYIPDQVTHSVRKVTPAGIITTVAGIGGTGGNTGDGGSATAATLSGPHGAAVDGAGNLYIADVGNENVRMVSATDGAIATLATGLNGPCGLAFDGGGNLYVADDVNDRVCAISSTGALTTVAGILGNGGSSGDGGSATAAAIGQPIAICFDAAGDLYICDAANGSVRKVDTHGIISTVAGGGGGVVATGVSATAVSVAAHGVAVDARGDIYVTIDNAFSLGVISPSGILGVIAGNGSGGFSGDGGSATAAKLDNPQGMILGQGTVTFSDSFSGEVRMVALPTAPVITSATTAAAQATQAFTFQLSASGTPFAYDVTGLPAGLTYSATTGVISGTPTVTGTVVASVAATNAGGTGAYQALTFTMAPPPGSPVITSASTATMTVGTPFTYQIVGTNAPTAYAATSLPSGLSVDATGMISGTPASITAANPGTFPLTIQAGNLTGTASATVTITETLPAGDIAVVAGNGISGFSGDAGAAWQGQIDFTHGVARDAAGNIYIADNINHCVRKVSVGGIITTVAGIGGSVGGTGDGGSATAATLSFPYGVAVDATGNLYISDVGNGNVRKVSAADGTISTLASGFNDPLFIACDGAGTVYVPDRNANQIYAISSTGAVTTVAGMSGNAGSSGDGGPATAAAIGEPYAVSCDAAGDLYISDYINHNVRKIDAGGIIHTVLTGIDQPFGLAADAAGDLYIDSSVDSQVLMLSPSGIVGVVAGNGTDSGPLGDGGNALQASVQYPFGLTLGQGTVTFSDAFVYEVRTVALPTAPAITSAVTAAAQVGQAFTFQLTASGTPFAYDVTGLPAGLTCDFTTGVISGTPTTSGTVAASVAATNAGGTGTYQTLTIGVAPLPPIPVIGSANAATMTVGQPFTYQISASNSPTAYNATSLPTGLSVSATGMISGTPTSMPPANPGVFPLTVLAGNLGGTASATVTVTETLPPDVIATVSPTLTGPYAVALDAAGDLVIGDTGANCVREETPSGTMSVVAGTPGISGSGGDGGSATAAALNQPLALAFDAAGNLYISDSSNARVRMVRASDGDITTFASGFAIPTGGLGFDSTGNLYVVDQSNFRVCQVSSASVVTTVAGNGSFADNGDGGPATAAAVGEPFGLCVDGAGNVYFGDTYNRVVREIDTGGIIHTVQAAGGTTAQGLAIDAAGDLYIADTLNSRIRMVSPSGIAGVVAGTGGFDDSGDGGIATAATLYQPIGIVLGNRTLLIADPMSNRIRMVALPSPPAITSAATAAAYVGAGFTFQATASGSPFAYDVTGLPAGLTYSATTGVISGIPTTSGTATANVAATNAGGTGTYQALVFTVIPPPVVSSGTTTMTVGQGFTYQIAASNGPTTYGVSGMPTGLSVSATGMISGTPTSMTLANPGTFAMTVTAGNASGTASATVTVTESMPAGLIANVAGLAGGGADTGDGGAAWAATFSTPFAVALDAAGDLYIADNNGQCVRMVTPAGIITTVAGTPGHGGDGGDGGSATAATLFDPDGLAVDGAGNLYIAEGYNGDIRVVSAATGIITTLASGMNYPQGLAFDGAGNLYVANNGDDTVCIVSGTGALTTVAGMSGDAGDAGDSGSATAAAIGQPGMIAFDSAGNLYICDTANNVVRKVDPTGIITTWAGDGGSANFVNDVPATAASVYFPGGIAIDAAGDVYIAEAVQEWITVVSPSGVIALVAGTGTTGATGDGGSATAATMSNPRGMVVGQGMLTFADGSNSAVRVVALPTPPVIDSGTVATAQVGQPFTFQPTAMSTDGIAHIAFDITGLPAGLTYNAISGAISGTPTTSGTVAASVAATNTGGTGAYQTLTITVLPPAPVITSATSANAVVGAAFTYQITADNSPTSFSASGLPDGLSVDATTGAVTGVPTTAGTFNATVIATNAGGSGSAPLAFTIVLPPIPVITSATGATVVDIVNGQGISYQITASGAATYAATNLPPGLTIDPNSGLISGTPTVAGTYQVTVTATNAGGTGSVTFTVNVLPLAPVITSLGIASARIGAAFTYQITATNDPTSYGASGLPPGLTIDPVAGTITGAATATGTYPATMTATNAGGFDTEALVISILPPVSANGPVITSATTASGQVGLQFGYQIIATDNPTLFGAANLPAGLTLNAATGAIIGTPTTAGTFTVTIAAINTDGTGIQTLAITIAPAGMVLTSAPVVVGQAGHGLLYQITATGNPTSFGATNLPPGLVIDTATGIITGVPQQPGSWTATITATGPLGTLSGPVIFYIADSGSDSKCGLGSGLGALLMAMMLLRFRRRR